MASLVQGYEYDIFVSYRHNDNRSGWVTEFVKALQEELAATIKEPVSVYFDSNAHDGLLETHNVNKSLEGKLKCLIFIPILSQTYCDPKSFAWQHEFCAFNKLAQQDQFGRDIKLNNGNVASRILPIKIHELDEGDKSTIENETGGVLRAIEFIYKEAGVNRPLRSNEENPNKNQNQTIHRNQVNKVANAIKDLIISLKSPVAPNAVGVNRNSISDRLKTNKSQALIVALFLTLVFALGAYWMTNRDAKLTASKSSIAVIPFRNNTGDQTKNVYGVGIASEVNTKLGLTKQFDFISALQATIKYQQTDDSPIKIGKELGVTHLLSGMYQTAGNNIQVIVELIDASSGKVLWNLPYRTRYDDIFQLQENIALQVMDKFSVAMPVADERHTKNMDAYYHCMRGREIALKPKVGIADAYVMSNAIPEFLKAIQLDSSFLAPWHELINLYGQHYILYTEDSSISRETVKPFVEYVERHFPESWIKKNILADYNYSFQNDLERAWLLTKEILGENPEDPFSVGRMSNICKRKLNLDEAFGYFQKWAKLEPASPSVWHNLGVTFRFAADYLKEEKAFKKLYRVNGIAGPLYYLKLEENKLDDLPKKIKEAYGKVYQADLLLQKRELKSLLAFSDTVRLDSIFTQSSKAYYKALSHFLLENNSEANNQAKMFLKLYKPNPSRQGRETLIIMNGICGYKEEASKQVVRLFSKRDQMKDLVVQWNKLRWEMIYHALSGNYSTADLLLKQMNVKFPQVGDYEWLNYAILDRIKKKYPAFQVTINNLKLSKKIVNEDMFNLE